MLFRFATWTLVASIVVCIVGAYQTGPAYPSEEVTVFRNLIPFEKFLEGDVIEPLLYGQYSITENVSPFIPINPLTGNLLAVQNSYQTPVLAKPLPPNFNVYKAPNPAPIQYKPTPSVNYAQIPPPIQIPPVNYAPPPSLPSYPSAPHVYATPTHGYTSAHPPVAVSYIPPLPVYSSTPAPLINSPQKLDIGLNYEQNQQQIFVPTAIYPNPSANYQPLIPLSVYKPSAAPVIYNQAKPIASKVLEDNKNAIELKKEDLPIEPKQSSTSVQNDPPKSAAILATQNSSAAALPTPSPSAQLSPPAASLPVASLPVASLPVASPPASPPASSPVLPTAPEKEVSTSLGKKSKSPTAENIKNPNQIATKSIDRPTGYRWLTSRSSTPIAPNQERARNYQTAYAYRSASPYVQSYSNPALTQRYANITAEYYKRSNVSFPQHSPAARPASKNLPATTANSNLNHGNSVPHHNSNSAYNQPIHYPQASPPNYQQTSIYNENNVAEIVLRDYSPNQEDNNNKAIIRVFEEGSYSLYFDMKLCNLRKDRIYSIYVHDHGQITAGCESAGALYGAKETYFNPMLGVKSNPKGFLGSIKSNGEPANVQHFAKNLLLRDLLGRSVVIHEIMPDPKIMPEALGSQMINNFSMLMNPLTSPLVTSRKIACGIIGRANPYTFLRPTNSQCEIEVAVVIPKTVLEESKKRSQKENESIKSASNQANQTSIEEF